VAPLETSADLFEDAKKALDASMLAFQHPHGVPGPCDVALPVGGIVIGAASGAADGPALPDHSGSAYLHGVAHPVGSKVLAVARYLGWHAHLPL
jgi:hypothetical protein